jgi:hypothetical protein
MMMAEMYEEYYELLESDLVTETFLLCEGWFMAEPGRIARAWSTFWAKGRRAP